MRFAIIAIAGNDVLVAETVRNIVTPSEDPVVVVDGPDAVLAHIVESETREVGFDENSARLDGEAEEMADHFRSIRDGIAALTFTPNGFLPVAIPSPWAGPANEGGIDWIVLPIAA